MLQLIAIDMAVLGGWGDPSPGSAALQRALQLACWHRRRRRRRAPGVAPARARWHGTIVPQHLQGTSAGARQNSDSHPTPARSRLPEDRSGRVRLRMNDFSLCFFGASLHKHLVNVLCLLYDTGLTPMPNHRP